MCSCFLLPDLKFTFELSLGDCIRPTPFYTVTSTIELFTSHAQQLSTQLLLELQSRIITCTASSRRIAVEQSPHSCHGSVPRALSKAPSAYFHTQYVARSFLQKCNYTRRLEIGPVENFLNPLTQFAVHMLRLGDL